MKKEERQSAVKPPVPFFLCRSFLFCHWTLCAPSLTLHTRCAPTAGWRTPHSHTQAARGAGGPDPPRTAERGRKRGEVRALRLGTRLVQNVHSRNTCKPFFCPKDANRKRDIFPRINKYLSVRVERVIMRFSLGFVSFRASSTAFAPCLRCSSRSGRSSGRRTPPNPEASLARWPAVAVAARRPPRPQAPLQRRLSSYRSSTRQPRAAEAGFGLGFGLLGLGRERVRVRVRTRFRVRL